MRQDIPCTRTAGKYFWKYKECCADGAPHRAKESKKNRDTAIIGGSSISLSVRPSTSVALQVPVPANTPVKPYIPPMPAKVSDEGVYLASWLHVRALTRGTRVENEQVILRANSD